MSADDSPVRPEVRVIVDDAQRRRRTRELWIAVAVCDVLLAAIVLVGVAADWRWWIIVLLALVPFAVSGLAMRAAVVLARSRER